MNYKNLFFQTNWIPFIFFTLIGIICCAITKHEFYWDLANYHYYNAFAFLTDRLNYDIVPSSVNTFFNPLIELPFYFLTQKFNDYPSIVYGFQGIFFGLLLFFFFKITFLFGQKNISL